MKVAIVGSNGQLGIDLCAAFAAAGASVLPLTHSEIEITSPTSVRSVMRERLPDVIVNTAAFHHVERCEQDPEMAYAINALGPKNLATAGGEIGAALVQVSTDYVFDGKKGSPYLEEDPPMPLSTYGNTKLAGEHFVRSIAPRHFVVRTSAIYGTAPCRGKGGRNFVELMLKLASERDEVRVVDDEVVTPTWTGELARQIVQLASSDAYGLYHATAEGWCSWHQFAAEIFRAANIRVRLSVADPAEFPTKVPRPKYSVLENRALAEARLNCFRDWRRGLEDYFAART